MVHNGIEYGLMAAYAEGLNILANADAGVRTRDADAETAPLEHPELYQYQLDIAAIAEVWRRGSVVGSWLLDLTAAALHASPELAEFSGRVSDSGEGRWTAVAAIDEGVPAPVLTAALQSRFDSQGSADLRQPGGVRDAQAVRRARREGRMSQPAPRPRVLVSATAEAAASAAAAEIVGRARSALADHGSFAIAVSGGRSPWRMLADLDALGMPWAGTTIYQVDERIGAADDPQRNLTGLRGVLPTDCPARVVPMPVEAADLAGACRDYAALLPPTLDVIQLGLGLRRPHGLAHPGGPCAGRDRP